MLEEKLEKLEEAIEAIQQRFKQLPTETQA